LPLRYVPKWSGSALLAVDCGPNVTFKEQDNISTFDSSDSSGWADSSNWADRAERGICQHCGPHLFYRLKQNQQYIMPVGLFDTDAKFDFTTQIFIEQMPDYYDFAHKTRIMTGEDVFSAFAEEK
jgi:hypothetical protein